MRIDKLTTKFQEALSDAQSLALGNDHAYIDPLHLLAAMLRQNDGPKALLERAGANVAAMSLPLGPIHPNPWASSIRIRKLYFSFSLHIRSRRPVPPVIP